MSGLWARFRGTRLYRSLLRYDRIHGNLLSAGIAFYAFFCVFPAFAIAAVVFGFVLRGDPVLLLSVGDALNRALPNFVRTADNPDGLITLEAPALSLLTIGGLVAVVGLVLSAFAWIGSFRDAIRTALGARPTTGGYVRDKLRDLGVFVVQGVAFLVSGLLTSSTGALAEGLYGASDLGARALLVSDLGLVVGFAVDVCVLALLLRVLSGVPVPWRTLWLSSALGAVLLGVVKYFGLELIEAATRNPLLGSVALVVGLLFWLNLIARIVLLTACWVHFAMSDSTPGPP